jgi:hypothetical protein
MCCFKTPIVLEIRLFEGSISESEILAELETNIGVHSKDQGTKELASESEPTHVATPRLIPCRAVDTSR